MNTPSPAMTTTTPLLLLPGLMNDERVWAPVADALAAEHPGRPIVIAPTHLEVGVEAIACSATAALPPGPFAVAGFSLGGYVAQAVCALAPDRITGLALLDTGARAETDEGRQARQRMIDAVAGSSSSGGGAGAGFDALAAAFLPRVVHPRHTSDRAITDLLLDMARRVGAQGFARQQQTAMDRPDRRELLRSLRVPSLVLCGRQDLTAPLALSEEMAGLIDGARLVVVEDSGHMVTLEQAQAVVRAVRDWAGTV